MAPHCYPSFALTLTLLLGFILSHPVMLVFGVDDVLPDHSYVILGPESSWLQPLLGKPRVYACNSRYVDKWDDVTPKQCFAYFWGAESFSYSIPSRSIHRTLGLREPECYSRADVVGTVEYPPKIMPPGTGTCYRPKGFMDDVRAVESMKNDHSKITEKQKLTDFMKSIAFSTPLLPQSTIAEASLPVLRQFLDILFANVLISDIIQHRVTIKVEKSSGDMSLIDILVEAIFYSHRKPGPVLTRMASNNVGAAILRLYSRSLKEERRKHHGLTQKEIEVAQSTIDWAFEAVDKLSVNNRAKSQSLGGT